jgi:pimeloyl-ACP methyl ester carboxylesterase
MNSEELIPETPDNWLDADVFAEFIDKKCSGNAIVVGYSLGSFLASKLAIKHPDKVKKLYFVNPFIAPNDKNEKPSSIPQLAKNPLLGTILGILLPLLSPAKMKTHLQNVFFPEQVTEDFLEIYLPRYTRFESLLATIGDKNSMIEILSDLHEKMAQIKCDTTVISGLKDAVCSAEEQNSLLKEKFAKINLVEIENGGHGLPFTHAKQVAEIIK